MLSWIKSGNRVRVEFVFRVACRNLLAELLIHSVAACVG